MKITKNKAVFGAVAVVALFFALVPVNAKAATNSFIVDSRPYVSALKEYVVEDIGSVIVSNTNIYNKAIKTLKKAKYNVTNLKRNVAEMKGYYKQMQKEVSNLQKDIKKVAKRATDFDQILDLVYATADEIDALAEQTNGVIEEINAELESL